MNELLPREQAYLQQFPPSQVQLDAVGEQVGAGGQHIVRAYDDCEMGVIKYPRSKTRRDLLSLCAPLITYKPDKVQADYELCREYFDDAAVTTKIVTDVTNTLYCILQPRLQIETLTPKLQVEHPALKDKLSALVDSNRRLMQDKRVWFDFMGLELPRLLSDQPYLSNVGVEHTPTDHRLHLFDFTLLSMPGFSLRGMFATIALAIQRRNMRAFGMKM